MKYQIDALISGQSYKSAVIDADPEQLRRLSEIINLAPFGAALNITIREVAAPAAAESVQPCDHSQRPAQHFFATPLSELCQCGEHANPIIPPQTTLEHMQAMAVKLAPLMPAHLTAQAQENSTEARDPGNGLPTHHFKAGSNTCNCGEIHLSFKPSTNLKMEIRPSTAPPVSQAIEFVEVATPDPRKKTLYSVFQNSELPCEIDDFLPTHHFAPGNFLCNCGEQENPIAYQERLAASIKHAQEAQEPESDAMMRFFKGDKQ